MINCINQRKDLSNKLEHLVSAMYENIIAIPKKKSEKENQLWI